MKDPGVVFSLILFTLSIGVATVHSYEINLAGTWYLAASSAESCDEAAPPQDVSVWKAIELPNYALVPDEVESGLDSPYQQGPCAWVRITFRLTPEQAGMNAVFRWEFIKWGFEAFVNGQPIGATELYSPGAMRIPAGTLREGENELLLKLRNWNSLPRGGKLDWPLIPAGSGVFSWGGKTSGVFGDVKLDLYQDVRIRSVVLRPDIAGRKVTAAIRCETVGEWEELRATVTILDVGGDQIASAARSFHSSDAQEVLVHVPLEGFALWTPDDPVLYTARVTLSSATSEYTREESFGMRSFEARDGDFCLNGEPFTVLGSNVVAEWLWSDTYYYDREDQFRSYFIDDVRRMNVRAVRTHTIPPLRKVARLCDEHGMLLLAEMPFTYNYQPVGFDLEEAHLYHERGRQMSLAWVEELANHPSIVMWVSTNEARPIGEFDQQQWDLEEMIPAIKELDPTRPVMRSGEESPDVHDMHCYDGFWSGAAGDYDEAVTWHAAARDPKRPIGNSEYIEGFPPDRIQRWLGHRDFDDEAAMFYAMVGMRQTEILRRLEFDLVLPYMMHGWTKGNWRPYAPSPMFGALRNALAPVAVSIDCSDRNAVAGSAREFSVWLINDLNTEVRAILSCYVLDSNPEFATEGPKYDDPAFTQKVTIAPRSRSTVQVPLVLPRAEGTRYVATLLDVEGGETVMSQRELHLYPPTALPQVVKDRTYRIVGCGDQVPAWFAERGIQAVAGIPYGRFEADSDVLIVWENARYSNRNLHIATCINAWLTAGRRVIMMQQHGWKTTHWHRGYPSPPNGPAIEYEAVPHRASLALPEENEIAGKLWEGLDRRAVSLWNGLNNAVCRDALAALPNHDPLPAHGTSKGPMPLSNRTIVIEGEHPSESSFVVDLHDPYHTVQSEEDLQVCELLRTRGSRPGLLCTNTPPDDAYTAAYEFEATEEMDAMLWVFEQGRSWASPFDWRIDEGSWQRAGTDLPMLDWTRVSSQGTTFAWSRLGGVKVSRGMHRLHIKVTQPKQNGRYLLSQDCFMLAPRAAPAQVVARSGDGQPVVVHISFDEGEMLITQLLLAERLLPASDTYDPVAERFMLNLIAY